MMRESVLYQQVLEEGEEKGQDGKARKIVLKMLFAGVSVEEIARFTDLSDAAIEELPRQSDHEFQSPSTLGDRSNYRLSFLSNFTRRS
jgi:predicted transposase YdaD